MPANEKKEKKTWQPKMFPIDGEIMQETAKLLSDLIQIDTTNPPGNETPAAEFCKKRLEKEGFENLEILESAPGRGSVICRWKGTVPNAKSILF